MQARKLKKKSPSFPFFSSTVTSRLQKILFFGGKGILKKQMASYTLHCYREYLRKPIFKPGWFREKGLPVPLSNLLSVSPIKRYHGCSSRVRVQHQLRRGKTEISSVEKMMKKQIEHWLVYIPYSLSKKKTQNALNGQIYSQN